LKARLLDEQAGFCLLRLMGADGITSYFFPRIPVNSLRVSSVRKALHIDFVEYVKPPISSQPLANCQQIIATFFPTSVA
jgi:hypothetical protein